MTIQPNTTINYTEGNRKVAVKFLNMISDNTSDNGLIGFEVNIRKGSQRIYGGSARVNPETNQVTLVRDGGMQEYIDKAIAAN